MLRWGWSEYESPDLPGLPAGVEAVAQAGATAPLEEADVLVVPSTVRVDAAATERLRRCKLVVTTTSGFDRIDLVALRRAEILCARLPLARRDAVVETTLGMILSLTRRLGRFQEFVDSVMSVCQNCARAKDWIRDMGKKFFSHRFFHSFAPSQSQGQHQEKKES